MKRLLEQCSGFERPDTIVHLGAGTCRELDAYLALEPGKIVLVEPNPEQLEQLRKKTDSASNIDVMECAVGGERRSNHLIVLSDPALSSLYKPTGIMNLMPGLRIHGEIEVAFKEINELIEQLALVKSSENWLVIDTPGVESELLAALQHSGNTDTFSHIFLCAGTESFYEGARPIEALSAELQSSGYRCVGAPDYSDNDFPTFHLHIDRSFIRAEQLSQELKDTTLAHQSDKEQWQATLSEKEQQLKDTTLTHQNDKEQWQATLSEKEQQLKDTTLAHQDDKEQWQATLSEKEQQLKDTTLAHQDDKEQWQATLSEKEQQVDVFNSKLQAQESALEELRSELQRKDADLSLALKLQMLRESDLEDLQARYGSIVELKNRQTELLKSVKDRLSAAASYLHQLDAENNPIMESEVTARLLDAISGTPDK